MEEELFAQFNKIANSILHLKSKEQRTEAEDSLSDTNTKQMPGKGCEVTAKCREPSACSLENVNPAMKIRALQVNNVFEKHSSVFLWSPSPSKKKKTEKSIYKNKIIQYPLETRVKQSGSGDE